jgi:hypothetical protein
MEIQENNFTRPDVADVYALLRKFNALVVHFSGAPKGSGIERQDHLYPNDLHHVINGYSMGGLSCSVVLPGDNFHGFERNATGCIGVILGFNKPESLKDASNSDCGSIEDGKGNRVTQNPRDISLKDLEKTINERNPKTYNEWVVSCYKVLGIFAVKPLEISFSSKPDYPSDIPDHLKTNELFLDIKAIEYCDVIREFSDQPIYTFSGTDIYRVTQDNSTLAEHKQIYK